MKKKMAEQETQVLEYIRLNGKVEELVARSDEDIVYVTYQNERITLTNFIKTLLSLINNRPTTAETNRLISTAVNNLVNGAPTTLDTLKEIADAIGNNQSVIDTLNTALQGKVDKVEGKGLSTRDFTDELYFKLRQVNANISYELTDTDSAPLAGWLATQYIKELQRLATPEQNGLMPKEDKKRVDELRGVWVGTAPPDEMLDGDIFILERGTVNG